MTAYYNEIDKEAAATLRELIHVGAIAPGDVDERDILDVRPDDLRPYTQCHFFAGVGIWSYALRLAGWDDSRPVWTGSCPCQPFSSAGKGDGFADERHLWPAWHYLIQHGKPENVPIFGEQVASKDGLAWLDLVQADLEGAGYSCWAIDLCAAGFGAPHIRQRLWFFAGKLADATSEGSLPGSLAGVHSGEKSTGTRNAESQRSCAVSRVANATCQLDDGGRNTRPERGAESSNIGADGILGDTIRPRLEGYGRDEHGRPESGRINTNTAGSITEAGSVSGMGNAIVSTCKRDAGEFSGTEKEGHCKRRKDGSVSIGPQYASSGVGQWPGPINGHWRDADWLLCRDGKWRPVEAGTFPLVDGTPARVGRLRCYGNGIVAQVAQAFIEATMTL